MREPEEVEIACHDGSRHRGCGQPGFTEWAERALVIASSRLPSERAKWGQGMRPSCQIGAGSPEPDVHDAGIARIPVARDKPFLL
jgi:hypothetical protein